MKKKALVAGVAVAFAAVLVLAAPGQEVRGPDYGFGVEVTPDHEFDDFVQCRLRIFELETEKLVAELPPLRIMAGDNNGLEFHDQYGLEVDFRCSVDRQQMETTYEVAATLEGVMVVNHLATVRLDPGEDRSSD